MEHLYKILYVVAGLLVYDKVVKPMLDKKKEGTLEENADIYE